MKLNPYLVFNGNCEEALNFYKTCLSGNIEYLQYFETAPGMQVPDSHKKKVLHASFRFGEGMFMACDTLPTDSYMVGNNFMLSIETKDHEAARKAFKALAESGKINMPLQETFWSPLFGMVKDKYGIQWMFNCVKPD